MTDKKLTTQEILAAARAQAGQAEPSSAGEAAGGQKEPAAAMSAPPPSPAPSEEKPAAKAEKPAAKAPASGGGPKSTKDILAAARAQATAQAAGGEEAGTPAEKAPASPKPAAAGGALKSTKDIMAAARAQAGSAGKGEAVPAAVKPGKAATKPATAAPAGDRPSVQEMIKAVREGKPAGAAAPAATATAAKEKVELPPRPQRPTPAARPVSEAARAATTRRNVLIAIAAAIIAPFSSAFAAAWTLFSAAVVAFGLASARFMMPNVLVEPPSKFKVGPPNDYPPESVSDKWKSQYGTWIVHTVYNGRDMIYALASICTHLGCTPNWLEGERKFKCPCHGSGFYINGVNFEGPAPRPLERYAVRVAEDGMIEVDKSSKFQQEMGQWEDSASFIPVG